MQKDYSNKRQHIIDDCDEKIDTLLQKQKNTQSSSVAQLCLVELMRISDLQEKNVSNLEQEFEQVSKEGAAFIANAGLEFNKSIK